MRTNPVDNPYSPRLRFLTALVGWMRVWQGSIVIALGLTVFGLFPTTISLFALLGPIWVPIVVLTLWGRLLDETMHPRSDMEDGCR